MKQRRRIYYSAAQRAEIWDRWRRGESMHDIGRLFDRGHSSVIRAISGREGITDRFFANTNCGVLRSPVVVQSPRYHRPFADTRRSMLACFRK